MNHGAAGTNLPNRRKALKTLGLLAVPGVALPALRQGGVQDFEVRLAGVPASHPSLHLTDDSLSRLRGNAAGSHRRFAERLQQWMEENREWIPGPPPSGDGAEVFCEETAAFVTNGALACLLSRDSRDLAAARNWILALSESPLPNDRNYGRGILAAGVARAYDWLFDQLKTHQQIQVRNWLREVLAGLYEGSLPGERSEWWSDLPLHHDAWIAWGGLGEASLALLGEVPEASAWAARARDRMESALGWLGDDGAWHEGVADWVYTLAPLLWFFGAWQTKVGEDLHQRSWLRNAARFRLFHRLPDDTYVALNDSFRSGRYNTSGCASAHFLRRLAALYGDSHAQWLAERDERIDLLSVPKGVFRAPYESLSYSEKTVEYERTPLHGLAWNLLWYRPDIPSESPSGPVEGAYFENQELVILRSGWGPDDAVVSLQGGPLGGRRAAERARRGDRLDVGNVHHAHAAYGALTLYAGGKGLAVPPGYGRRSSRFQNVVCVDGADFVADPSIRSRIVEFRTSSEFQYAVAEAAEGFPKHLGVTDYYRHVLFFPNRRCVVLDELSRISRGGNSFSQFEWRLHYDPGSYDVSAKSDVARWTSRQTGKVDLEMTILEPTGFAWENRQLESASGAPLLGCLAAVRPEWYSTRMLVLAVLDWTGAAGHPSLVRNKGQVAVSWEGDPDGPDLLFVGPESLPPEERSRGKTGVRKLTFPLRSK